MMSRHTDQDDFMDFDKPRKRSNSLQMDQAPTMLQKSTRSYLEHEENNNSSDSDSDFSEKNTEKRNELRRKNTYCGIEIKK